MYKEKRKIIFIKLEGKVLFFTFFFFFVPRTSKFDKNNTYQDLSDQVIPVLILNRRKSDNEAIIARLEVEFGKKKKKKRPKGRK